MRARSTLAVAWAVAATLMTAMGSRGAELEVAEASLVVPAPQGALARGAKVTFETVRGDQVRHSERARLLSLAVDRGETPTPFLPVGAFRATYEVIVTLPARDRMKFHLDGRGKAKLTVNGKVVLEGSLSLRKSLETKKAVRLKKGGNDIKIEFESAARGDGALRVFWSGYDFGFEPITPEVMSYPATDEAVLAGEQLRQGHQLFVERRCARCHDFDEVRLADSAYLELDRTGPDLRLVGSRVRQGWMAKWMKDPHEVRPEATMPKFPLAGSDAVDLASYLVTLGDPQPHAGFSGEQVEAGAARYRELGCVACHSNDGSDGIGPTWKNTYGTNRSLTSGEAVVIDDNYIKNSIVNPMSQVAQGYAPVMPAYATLSEEELNAITDYIKTLSE